MLTRIKKCPFTSANVIHCQFHRNKLHLPISLNSQYCNCVSWSYKTQCRCHNKRKRKNTKLKLIKQIAWKFSETLWVRKKYPFLKCLKNRLQVNQWGWGSLCVQKDLKDGCSIMSAAMTTFMACDHTGKGGYPHITSGPKTNFSKIILMLEFVSRLKIKK